MTTEEILQKAKDRIAAPENWCQEELSRDKSGKRCDPTELTAAAWCASGAISYVMGRDAVCGDSAEHALRDASLELFGEIPASVNDSGTHEQVMRIYDVAIQKARTRESKRG